ncbi:MAG: hypothetical protein IPG97_16425 [Microthrixaceae bacterium]|nr:hypothetical protein [Microthrixaceae bacterium]
MSDERPGWHRHPNGGGWVEDTASVDETAFVGPTLARVRAARVFGAAWVSGTAQVSGAAEVFGNAWVCGNAEVSGSRHVLTVGPIGSEDQTLTLFRAETGYWVSVGCWHPDGATLDDLTAEVQRRAPDHADEYEAAMALCRVRIAEWEKR